MHDTGIIHQNVDLSKSVFCALNSAVNLMKREQWPRHQNWFANLALFRNISLDCKCLTSASLDFTLKRLQSVKTAANKHNLGTKGS
jgi:hypothetical protein